MIIYLVNRTEKTKFSTALVAEEHRRGSIPCS